MICIALKPNYSNNYGLKTPADKPFEVKEFEALDQIERGNLAKYVPEKTKQDTQPEKITKEEKAAYFTKEAKTETQTATRKRRGRKPSVNK